MWRYAAYLEAVFVLVYCSLRAGDRAAFEVGVAFDVHCEAAIARFEAALLCHAGIATVDVAFCEVHIAGHASTNHS